MERQGYKLREKEDIEHMDKLETTIVKTNPGKKSKLSDKVKNMLNIPDAADTQQQTAISNSDVVTEAVPPTIEVVNSSIEVQTASKQTIKKANTLIGSKVFKTFKINDEDNEEKDYEGEVKSLDETTNLYYLVYEHGKEDYLKKMK